MLKRTITLALSLMVMAAPAFGSFRTIADFFTSGKKAAEVAQQPATTLTVELPATTLTVEQPGSVIVQQPGRLKGLGSAIYGFGAAVCHKVTDNRVANAGKSGVKYAGNQLLRSGNAIVASALRNPKKAIGFGLVAAYTTLVGYKYFTGPKRSTVKKDGKVLLIDNNPSITLTTGERLTRALFLNNNRDVIRS